VKDRRQYERAVQIVGYVIHKWDPYGLLASGAPADEFSDEIARIVVAASKAQGPNDLADALSAILSQAFEPHAFTPADCLFHASKIFYRLRDEKLIAAA
jgi:hypothetical protein